jgi:hypothetical protein
MAAQTSRRCMDCRVCGRCLAIAKQTTIFELAIGAFQKLILGAIISLPGWRGAVAGLMVRVGHRTDPLPREKAAR